VSEPSEGPDEEPATPASVAARRRLIQKAIREGADEPPEGLREVALRIAIRQASFWWTVVLAAIGVGVEAVSVALADTTSERVLYTVLGLLFLAYGLLQRRQVRRGRAAVRKWAPPAST
jgi:hypothetical protein